LLLVVFEMNARKPSILLLGDPRLRKICLPVVEFDSKQVKHEKAALVAVLEEFRARNGFGRAISAPQVSIFPKITIFPPSLTVSDRN